MHKRFAVVAGVVVVWGIACATRSKGSEPAGPETVTMESKGAGATQEVDCQNVSITVSSKMGGSGKSFGGRDSWSVNEGCKLIVTNDMPDALCLSILASDGGTAITPVSLPVSDAGQDIPLPAPGTDYTLGVCTQSNQKGNTCSNGCKEMTTTATGPGITDTIKGNLSVVTQE